MGVVSHCLPHLASQEHVLSLSNSGFLRQVELAYGGAFFSLLSNPVSALTGGPSSLPAEELEGSFCSLLLSLHFPGPANLIGRCWLRGGSRLTDCAGVWLGLWLAVFGQRSVTEGSFRFHIRDTQTSKEVSVWGGGGGVI